MSAGANDLESGLKTLFAPLAAECDSRLRAIVAAQEALLAEQQRLETALVAIMNSIDKNNNSSDAATLELERRVQQATRTLLDAATRIRSVRERVDVVALRCTALERAVLGDVGAVSRSGLLVASVDGQLVQPVVATAAHVADKGRSVLSGLVHHASGLASTVGETAVRLTKAGAANASAAASAVAAGVAAASPSPTPVAAPAAPLPCVAFDAATAQWRSVLRDDAADAVPERRDSWAVAQIDGAAVLADAPLAPRDAADFVMVWCGEQLPVQVLARLQQTDWCRAFFIVQHTFAIVLLRHRPHVVRLLPPSRALLLQTDASFAFVLTNTLPTDEWRAELRAAVPNAMICWPTLDDAPAGQEAFGDNLPAFTPL